jgi:hypothetical protein
VATLFFVPAVFSVLHSGRARQDAGPPGTEPEPTPAV